jgi:hypothetical protein
VRPKHVVSACSLLATVLACFLRCVDRIAKPTNRLKEDSKLSFPFLHVLLPSPPPPVFPSRRTATLHSWFQVIGFTKSHLRTPRTSNRQHKPQSVSQQRTNESDTSVQETSTSALHGMSISVLAWRHSRCTASLGGRNEQHKRRSKLNAICDFQPSVLV